MFTGIGKEYAKILRHLGKEEEAIQAEKYIAEMKGVVEEQGWDGEWFLRAYDDSGNKVGSKDNPEGKIFIEPQGYCIMGGIGLEDGKAKKALESSRKYLDTRHGLVLVNPPFSGII